MQSHNFIKTEGKWKCSVCGWEWKSKTTTLCPGVTRYEWSTKPPNLKTAVELKRLNLKPKPSAEVRGTIFSMKNGFYWLYDDKDSEIDNPDLPPIVSWDNRAGLKTPGELKKLQLEPGDTKPKGVASVWDTESEEVVWIPLYNPEECCERDSLITKTVLKERYLLSESWVKKIGEPDKLYANKYNTVVKLYSTRRVETFLAENAEEYAAMLVRREKYLEIFAANKERILTAAKLSREKKLEEKRILEAQMARCFQCASGASTPQGFLCVIYPTVKKIPCPDWTPRQHRTE
ncbi:MAG: hypothetical protein SAK29_17115 [Scytonema sp. PMC 1069.18]|nr:hypothetical protein [Scytonema sp. PMC 1069.18]MEC4887588.1 hypothetical protein [Scytonema sp. PMC 1070.18]